MATLGTGSRTASTHGWGRGRACTLHAHQRVGLGKRRRAWWYYVPRRSATIQPLRSYTACHKTHRLGKFGALLELCYEGIDRLPAKAHIAFQHEYRTWVTRGF
jgi:hypothetical protein